MQTAERKRTLAAWLAAFFLVALGAKLWTIQLWATNLPYWDQWDEARLLFQPWLDGTLSWQNFFIPHNEHRIVFTRLLDLIEVQLNGQWDIYLQTVVNAVIHLAYGCGVATLLWHFTGRKNAGLICCSLLPLFALPFAAENTVHGFQSQFYFANIFSVLAIVGLGFGRPCGKLWFGGLLAAVAALFTMASGFLASATVIGLLLLRITRRRVVSRNEILIGICALAVVALGLGLKVDVAQHAQLQSGTLPDFLAALLSNLAWPFSSQPWLIPLLCLPVVLVTVKYFRGGFADPRAAEFVLALAGWAFLQALVLAYGRARIAESSRYLDALSALPLANGFALFVLAAENDFSARLKKLAVPCALVWSGILIFGQVQSSRVVAENYLEGTRGWGLAQVETVRAFIASSDAAALKNTPREAVPYWSADWLVEILRQPKLVALLPNDAFPLGAEQKNHGRFSAAALTIVDNAVPVLCGGCGLVLLLAIAALRRPGNSMHNEALARLCVLMLALVVGIGAWAWRGTNRVSYAVTLHKKLATVYANSARPADALVHLRVALRLQPGDAEAQKELETIQSRIPQMSGLETK